MLPVVGPGETELSRLTDAVGHPHMYRHVLPGQRGLHQPVIDPLEHEGHDVRGFRDLRLHRPVPPHRLRLDPARTVKPPFLVDQRIGHQPVHLIPGGGDLRRDRTAENVDDRPHQLVVYDLVLLGPYPQRRVLVRDPRHQLLRSGVGGHQAGCEGRHRPGERLLLGTIVLVAAVEGPVEQARVRCEQPLVEACGDLLNVFTDHRQCGFDDGTRL